MPEAKDTQLRLLTLLSLIPVHPRFTTTTTLQEKLQERGYSVDLRTVQRDLNRISPALALTNEKKDGRNRWSFAQESPLAARSMEPATALALHLAEDHLQSLLPKSVLDLLSPHFRQARNYLDELARNDLAHWAKRVRALPNGKALLPAPVNANVWQEVSTALLQRRQLRISYLSRSQAESKERLLNPAGLISRHAISYLIASVDGYSDLRQFALQRIQQAECLETPASEHPDFEIDRYIRQDLNTAAPIEPVQLVADISPQIAWLLSETSLSDDQTLEALPDSDWKRLRATVPDDQETLWWVFGLGENVRVWEPQQWVQEIRKRIAKLEALYAQ